MIKRIIVGMDIEIDKNYDIETIGKYMEYKLGIWNLSSKDKVKVIGLTEIRLLKD